MEWKTSDIAIKTAPDKVSGYLVRFRKDNETDLYGEYFDEETNFGDATTVPVFFDHGLDRWIGREQIGVGTLTRKSDGIWIDAELTIKSPEKFKKEALERRRRYLEAIEELVDNKALGWSSGAVGHLVVRSEGIGGTYLKQWIIGEASLTPTPAEPANEAIVKAYTQALKNLWLLKTQDEEMNTKVGAKISRERLEKLRQAVELLNSIITEIEPEEEPDEPEEVEETEIETETFNKNILLSKLIERVRNERGTSSK